MFIPPTREFVKLFFKAINQIHVHAVKRRPISDIREPVEKINGFEDRLIVTKQGKYSHVVIGINLILYNIDLWSLLLVRHQLRCIFVFLSIPIQ